MEAFQAALESGADGIEFDVRLSADGVPIVHHNLALQRDGQPAFISDLTLSELESIPLVSDMQAKHYSISTLEAVLATFASSFALEVHLQSYSPETITAVAELLTRYDAHWSTIEVTSYEPAILRGIQTACAGLATDYLFNPEGWMTEAMALHVVLEKAALARARAVHLIPEAVSSATVERLRENGFDVHSHAEDRATLEKLRQAGIERVTTSNMLLWQSTQGT